MTSIAALPPCLAEEAFRATAPGLARIEIMGRAEAEPAWRQLEADAAIQSKRP